MNIRKIKSSDKEDFLAMSKDFYSTPAVAETVPESHFANTFNAMMYQYPNLDGYIMIDDNNNAMGYCLTNTFWSNEAGGKVCLLDELYIKPSQRYMGYGKSFLRWLSKYLEDVMKIRIDIMKSNDDTVKLYESCGYTLSSYSVMMKKNATPDLSFMNMDKKIALKTHNEKLPESKSYDDSASEEHKNKIEVKIINETPKRDSDSKAWWETLS